MNTASAEYLHISTHEPLETRKNHHELLLQEDALIFLLHSEHICTPSNFTLIAHPSATSEGSLHRSDGGFPEQMCHVASTADLLSRWHKRADDNAPFPLAMWLPNRYTRADGKTHRYFLFGIAALLLTVGRRAHSLQIA